MAKANKTTLEKLRESESSTSIIFGAIVVVVVGLLLVNYWKSNNAQVSDTGLSTEQTVLEPNENGYVPPSVLPTEHMVVKGEHLWGIAEKYFGSGYNWVDINSTNKLDQKSSLEVGMKLTIPAVAARKSTVATVTAAETSVQISGESYTVLANDSLWDIAVRAYGDGYKWTSIYEANKDVIKNPNMIDVGWNLKLPR